MATTFERAPEVEEMARELIAEHQDPAGNPVATGQADDDTSVSSDDEAENLGEWEPGPDSVGCSRQPGYCASCKTPREKCPECVEGSLWQ